MKKLLKISIPILCLMLVGALIGYGVYRIPGSFSHFDGDRPETEFYYTLEADASTLADQTDATYRAKVKLLAFCPSRMRRSAGSVKSS